MIFWFRRPEIDDEAWDRILSMRMIAKNDGGGKYRILTDDDNYERWEV